MIRNIFKNRIKIKQEFTGYMTTKYNNIKHEINSKCERKKENKKE